MRSLMTVAELIAAADAEYKNGVDNAIKVRAFKKCMEDNYMYMFDVGTHKADIVGGYDFYFLPADCSYEDIIAVYVNDVLYYGQKVEERWNSSYTYKRSKSSTYPDREGIEIYPEPSENSTNGLVIYYNKRPFFNAWGINPDGQLAHKNLALNGRDGRLNNELYKDGDFEIDAGAGVATGFTANSLADVTYSISDEFPYTGDYSQKAVATDDDKYLEYDIEFHENEATVTAAIVRCSRQNFIELKNSNKALGQLGNDYIDEAEFIYATREADSLDPDTSGLKVYFATPKVTFTGTVTSYVDSLVVINLSRNFSYTAEIRPETDDFVRYLKGLTDFKVEAEQAVINYVKHVIARTQKDIEMANGFYADYQEEIDKLYEIKQNELDAFKNFDSIDRNRRWF